MRSCRITRADDEGRHVTHDNRAAAHHGVLTDMHELMDTGLTADNGEILHMDVTGKTDVIRENHVVAHLAVMRHVHVHHVEAARTNPGDALILRGANRHRAVFTDHVLVADLKRGILAGILLILRRASDAGTRIDLVAFTDSGPPRHGDVADQNGS